MSSQGLNPKVNTQIILKAVREYKSSSNELDKEKQRNRIEEQDTSILTSCLSGPVNSNPISWSGIIDVINSRWYNFESMQHVICAIYAYVINTTGSTTNVHIRRKLDRMEKIDIVSAVGMLYYSRDRTLVIKTASETFDNEGLIHEYFITLAVLNDLRKTIPNFSMILGRFNCSLPLNYGNVPFAYCRNIPSSNYLIYENVKPSISFPKFMTLASANILLISFYQIVLALHTAYEHCRFTHYDLNQGNIVVRLPTSETPNFARLKGFFIPYRHPTRGNILLTATGIMTFIDYGYSYVEYKGKSYGKYDLGKYGIEANHPFPMHDIYKILMTVIILLKTSSSDKSSQLAACQRMYSFFSDETLDSAIARNGQESAYFALPNIPEYSKVTYADFLQYLDKEFAKELTGYVFSPGSTEAKRFDVLDVSELKPTDLASSSNLGRGASTTEMIYRSLPDTLEDANRDFINLDSKEWNMLASSHLNRFASQIHELKIIIGSPNFRIPIVQVTARRYMSGAMLKAYDKDVARVIAALDTFWYCIELYKSVAISRLLRRAPLSEQQHVASLEGKLGESKGEQVDDVIIKIDNVYHNFYLPSLTILRPVLQSLLGQKAQLDSIAISFLNGFEKFLFQNDMNKSMTRRFADSLYNASTGPDKPTIVDAKISWYAGATKGSAGGPALSGSGTGATKEGKDDLIRVSCIKDGSCGVHAFLRGSSEEYRKLGTVEERMQFARTFRNGIADVVTANYNELDKKFSLAAVGWSKDLLVKELRSTCQIGVEVFGLLADQSSVNIQALQLFDDGSYEVVEHIPASSNVHVIILQVEGHFENIIRREDNKYIVNFDSNDPFIQACTMRKFKVAKNRTISAGAANVIPASQSVSRQVNVVPINSLTYSRGAAGYTTLSSLLTGMNIS